ncbi:MutS-related protein [Tenacibaculum sp. FZY0031]|uniref:MutS-related protein n=1 Tax=Tenacibaculum sp. FZY0031 TaxID=3116648 RepID=UPI002ED499DD
MQQPQDFYNKELKDLALQLSKINSKITFIRILRLLVFLGFSLGVYLTFYQPYTPFIIGFIGILLFAFLVIQHQQVKEKRTILQLKKDNNQLEIDVLNGHFEFLPEGTEFTSSTHYYSNDIDLFGNGSFFQYTNRTATTNGKKLLASLLTSNSIHFIEEKQKALKELSEKIHWRQHFTSLAHLVSSTTQESLVITKWLTNYESKLTSSLRWISMFFSSISIALIVLLVFSAIPFSVVLIWFFIGLTISALHIKKTQHIYTSSSKVKDTFKQYYLLLEQIEKETFTSALLKEKQQKIATKTKKASVIFKEFSKILDTFDQRNNIIIAIIGNGLFLWDIALAIRVEKWILSYKETTDEWFSVVNFFDAYNSFANFVFNHPTFTFPTLQNENNGIIAQHLGHPLLKSSKRVDNDFTISKGQFFIITGANMAGKSTFLRTVSLSIVMANCGLPVCASNYQYTPIKLITSMRTSDSLTEDESYFYSELKRLKFIVDTIETDRYFIILDEILKGTNSKDKASGSRKFVEKLTRSKSTGIIATHDVSLCELANEYPQILNYYFDAEIVNNELFFDYTIKSGTCKNMNASFLLKKMEIV